MLWNIVSLFWLLSFFLVVKSQFGSIRKPKVITESDDAFQCALIIRGCQSQCDKFGGSYVRWKVDLRSRALSCKKHNETEVPAKSNEDPRSGFTFDVLCCGGNRTHDPMVGLPRQAVENGPSIQAKQEEKCIDQRQLDTLFILGVATLGSILLMCAFVLLGLILYKRRTRYYKYGQPPLNGDENQSLVKETEKNTNAFIAMTDFGNDKSGCSSPNKSIETPPKYFTAKTTTSSSSRSSKSEPEPRYVNGNEVPASRPNVLGDSVGQSGSVPTVIMGKQGLADESERANGLVTSKRRSGRMEIAGEYEIRGGFIRPINKNVEPRSMKFLTAVEPENNQNQTADPITPVINVSETPFQTTAIKSKSSEVVEDPYVQAPPLKSLRSQQKAEPTAYQKLIPSNSTQKHETGDYNMLLHNAAVGTGSDAKQFLILNNNSKPSACSSDDKCKVILKSTSASTPVQVGVTS